MANSSQKFKKFVPFCKVDSQKREVWGIVTAEVEDKDGEICEYSGTVPYYRSLVDEMSKATNGENLCPLREMHQLSAVGKGISIDYRDEAKEIYMGFKIVDDAAWKLCDENVYTGFSQGGSYVKKYKKGGKQWYISSPAEVSLVDNPCLGVAHFEYVKADGSVEIRKIRSVDAASKPRLKKEKKIMNQTMMQRLVALSAEKGISFSEVKAAQVKVAKSMYDIADMASLLSAARYLMLSCESQASWEEDENDAFLAVMLRDWITDGIAILQEIVTEETDELIATNKVARGDNMEELEKKSSLKSHYEKKAAYHDKSAGMHKDKSEHHADMVEVHKAGMDACKAKMNDADSDDIKQAHKAVYDVHKANLDNHKFGKAHHEKMHKAHAGISAHYAKMAESASADSKTASKVTAAVVEPPPAAAVIPEPVAVTTEPVVTPAEPAVKAAVAAPVVAVPVAEVTPAPVDPAPAATEPVAAVPVAEPPAPAEPAAAAPDLAKSFSEALKPLADALAALKTQFDDVIKTQASQVQVPAGLTLIPRAPVVKAAGAGSSIGEAAAAGASASDAYTGL